jgi:hypothetical protein
MSINQSITTTQEERKKRDLRALILKNRKKLIPLVTKCEMLKVELEMVQQEYTVRVGQLFHKSGQQDLDIIYYNNLLTLLEQGKTYEEAVDALADTYYAKQRKLEEEREQMERAKKIYEKRTSAEHAKEDASIKELWKKLVSKFHPDLVQDEKEKKRREEIMKQLNQAYEEQNIEVLQNMQNEVYIENIAETTVEKLIELLEMTENKISEQQALYLELKNSEWYRWKISIAKAKAKKQDVFLNLEKALLDEIVRKIDIIKDLKQKLGLPVD